MISALAAITVGVSLYTYHVPEERMAPALKLSNDTPGLYVRVDDWTVGTVRNSFERQSWYAAWNYDMPNSGLTFTVGAITGYQYRTLTGSNVCRKDWRLTEYQVQHYGYQCHHQYGQTNAVLRPLVAVSYVFDTPYLQPRVSLLGKGIHFSIERSFK